MKQINLAKKSVALSRETGINNRNLPLLRLRNQSYRHNATNPSTMKLRIHWDHMCIYTELPTC